MVLIPWAEQHFVFENTTFHQYIGLIDVMAAPETHGIRQTLVSITEVDECWLVIS